MKKIYVISIEFELDADDEGLTSESWETISKFQNAIETMRYDYGWSEIKRISNPKLKD